MARSRMVLPVCRHHLRSNSPAKLCERTHALGLLARILMALLGCPLVSFLLATCGRQERTDKIYRWPVHTPGYLHRMDSRLSAAHGRHARRTGDAALIKASLHRRLEMRPLGRDALCRHARMMEGIRNAAL